VRGELSTHQQMTTEVMMRIGIIADTHGVLPAGARHALAGVSLILHAGDIGSPAVMTELGALARVVAVRGNTDVGAGAQEPLTQRLLLEGVDIFLCHDPSLAVNLTPPPRVIVHGHTHQPKNLEIAGILWFNPGSATRPRPAQLGATVGILTVERGMVQAEIVSL